MNEEEIIELLLSHRSNELLYKGRKLIEIQNKNSLIDFIIEEIRGKK